MAVKFVYIAEDPYTNQSDEFILILGIWQEDVPIPSSPGLTYQINGVLRDPNGNLVYAFTQFASQDYEVTGTLSDEAYSHSYSLKTIMVIPPGWKFEHFHLATGIQGTLEELAPFIKGMS